MCPELKALHDSGLAFDELLTVFLSSFEASRRLWPEYRQSLPDEIDYHLDWSTNQMPEPYRTKFSDARAKWEQKRQKIEKILKKHEHAVPSDLQLGWIRLNTRTVYLDKGSGFGIFLENGDR